MTLEDRIYNRLTGSNNLQRELTSYDGKPAVFYLTAPDDKATGWKQKKQYPRIDYAVDLQRNPERKTSGVLTLNILCTDEGKPPEELEPIVRQLLCGVFLLPDNAPPFALSWARSDAFDQQRSDGDGLITGITVSFDVYAFPTQTTSDPDPILAMHHYIEQNAPEAFVIGGRNTVAEEYTPTAKSPAFYFRLEQIQRQRETNTVAWMDAVIACHIFADGEEIAWLKAITDALAVAGEVIMLDNSPMFITNIKADSTLDALTTGQLRIYCRFGILRQQTYHHPLLHANREYEAKGGN